MSYKTVLTIIGSTEKSGPVLDTAIDVARREAAHLKVLCLGIDVAVTGYYYAGMAATVTEATSALAQVEAENLESAARKRLAVEDINWEVETLVTLDSNLSHLIARRARFADLVVLPRPYGAQAPGHDEVFLEAALFAGLAPVLVMPAGDGAALKGEKPLGKVVLAWNESDEALAAMRASLPVLKQADLVSITMIDPRPHAANRADPGIELAEMLERHGVETRIDLLAQTLPSVAETLCQHATDLGADLVVMGAYGHSRFRESILGGATRDMLEKASVPMLMAH